MNLEGRGQHVLLTGANGFVASHILATLVERGYAVTATVRSQSKADEIIRTHPSWQGKVKFALVSDFTSQESLGVIFQNAPTPLTHVIHTASPVKFVVEDIREDMIEPAVNGTTQILKSAIKYGGQTLKRFILLGSAGAVLNPFEYVSGKGDHPYTENDWNPVTVEEAVELKDDVVGYTVSKAQAELHAWEIMKTEKPSFDLTVVNPSVITGPMIHPISGSKSINETNRFVVASMIDNPTTTVKDMRFPFLHHIDVRDVARIHVDLLSNPAAGGKRILLVAQLMTPQLVVNAIRKNFPSLRDRVQEGTPSKILPGDTWPNGWDTKHSLDIISHEDRGKYQFISLEQSVVDTVQSMIDHDLL
ncbi:hypothetical protein BDV36DRAFT_289295 [Aspergillus pseudocaelatus]|uniref:NAD-dependent epimerase/dehydratase domain-containing protein n=1 Tax=Aspergillus pseudocaelatus TaxID=1825620 RepID=A0ABQ6W0W4_9EURO|nr:hypothetical protein BDV36DRAFT_289295 [Aspergillus pseudocaelatus]